MALGLENGLVGQGGSRDDAVEKLKEALVSFKDVLTADKYVYKKSLSVKDLHDFLCSVGNNQEIEKGRKTNAPNSR